MNGEHRSGGSKPAVTATETLTTSKRVRIDVHSHPADATEALRTDVVTGLSQTPKTLPSKWFYDERGSQLFDEITRLPEYYPTLAERSILASAAREIVARSRADTLVELGSGTSEKTRLLLDAMRAVGRLRWYIPFDVSEETLRASARAVSEEYSGIHVHGVVGDFERHLHLIPSEGRRMVAFLGSTIGNFEPKQRHAFLLEIADSLDPQDTFLLGCDLVKDVGRLETAYDDAAGVTAAFNRNVLNVINAALDADFEPHRFVHRAFFDPENEWIEMRLHSLHDQMVHIRDLDLRVRFAAGEEIRTEISTKFRRQRIEDELHEAGLEVLQWWCDRDDDFAVLLTRTF